VLLLSAAREVGERFDVIARLGAGGEGVVYRAWDREARAYVALKTLHQPNRRAWRRLREEFLAQQDLRHPNLVRLHELFETDEHGFFSMEWVQGVDFLNYVRRPGPNGERALDVPRLRSAFAQLATALDFLHRSNKVHRDVKPTNIRVTFAGRVVLLDFGLVAEISDDARDSGAGTQRYMAPEQVTTGRVAPTVDWYAAGTLLYEALTGQPPFAEVATGLLRAKTLGRPVPPHQLAEVPADLSELCVSLLAPEPEQRPIGSQVLSRLGVTQGPEARLQLLTASLYEASACLGRERELEMLCAALSRGQTDARAAQFWLVGARGVGKSALLAELGTRVERSRPDALVLGARARAIAPQAHGALHSILSCLAEHVRAWSFEALGLPIESVAPLLEVFPILRRIEALAAQRAQLRVPDPVERRWQALDALCALVGRVSKVRPVLLVIDDFDHVDRDTERVVSALLGVSGSSLMLVLSVTDAEPRTTELASMQRLQIDVLDQAHTLQLARALVQSLGARDDSLALELTRQSGGHPFLLRELVRERMILSDANTTQHTQIEDLFRGRLARLSTSSRALLELMSVAVGPIPRERALLALGCSSHELANSVRTLWEAGFLLAPRSSEDDLGLELASERLASLVSESLEPREREARHAELASAMTGHPNEVAELAHHAREAGKHLLGAEAARVASDQAARVLAFDRAAAFAVAERAFMRSAGGDCDLSQRRSLAHTLTLSGRVEDAASLYAELAVAGLAAEQLEARQHRVQLLLHAGRVDSGTQAAAELARSVGLELAPSSKQAFRAVIWHRAWLALRGLGFKQRAEHGVPERDLTQLDVLWSLGTLLTYVDVYRGADFQTRGLLLALRAGEPRRLARALAWEAFNVSQTEGPSQRKARALFERAQTLAGATSDASLEACLLQTQGQIAFCAGDLSQAISVYEQAERVFRERCDGARLETSTVQQFLVGALVMAARHEEHAERVERYLKQARDMGDHFAVTNLVTLSGFARHLRVDDPDRAEREIADVMARWPREPYLLQHFFELLARTYIDIYRGGTRGLDRFDRERARLDAAGLHHIHIVRYYTAWMELMGALCAARVSEGVEQSRLLRRASKASRRLRKQKTRLAVAHAHLADGVIGLYGGDVEGTRRHLQQSIEIFRKLGQQSALYGVELMLAGLPLAPAGEVGLSRLLDAAKSRGVQDPHHYYYLHMLPGRPA